MNRKQTNPPFAQGAVTKRSILCMVRCDAIAAVRSEIKKGNLNKITSLKNFSILNKASIPGGVERLILVGEKGPKSASLVPAPVLQPGTNLAYLFIPTNRWSQLMKKAKEQPKDLAFNPLQRREDVDIVMTVQRAMRTVTYLTMRANPAPSPKPTLTTKANQDLEQAIRDAEEEGKQLKRARQASSTKQRGPKGGKKKKKKKQGGRRQSKGAGKTETTKL